MLDVGQAPDALRALSAALAGAGPELRRQINTRTRQEMNPVWRSEVASRARTPLDRATVGSGVRVRAGNPPALLAAQSRRPTSGGLVPAADWPGVEFGATDRNRRTTYTRRVPGGGTTSVTRRTRRQMPARVRTGRIAYPAVKATAPRMASLWAATAVKTVYVIFDENGPI